MQVLSDAQWAVLKPLIDAHRTPGGVRSENERGLVEAALYRLRTGCQWRAVPAEIASWQRAAELFLRWSRNGTWARVFLALRDRGEPLLDAVMLDGTVIRAHAKAAGQKGGAPRRLAVHGAGSAPKRASSAMVAARRSPSQ